MFAAVIGLPVEAPVIIGLMALFFHRKDFAGELRLDAIQMTHRVGQLVYGVTVVCLFKRYTCQIKLRKTSLR